MRAVVQRVKRTRVSIDGNTIGSIGKGLNVLVGVGDCDNEKDAAYLAEKITNLRIFDDGEGKMNLSILDLKEMNEDPGMLIISQFTLYGDCRKGRRPSFIKAQLPHKANTLHEHFISLCRQTGIKTETGVFGADMQVEILNDGPVTILIDSKKEF